MINSKKNKFSRIFKIQLRQIQIPPFLTTKYIYIYILQPLKNFNRCLKRSSFDSERRNIDEGGTTTHRDPSQLQIRPLRRKFVSRSIIKRIPSLVPLARRGRGKDWQEVRGGNRGHCRWIIRPWSIASTVAAASSGELTHRGERATHNTTVLVAP